ncbi:MAG: hypothetical protein FJY56_11895, partial [Betaproteobacteria bacterium]|nr:hypothetical protein [Betaproteobacteria bacterium]
MSHNVRQDAGGVRGLAWWIFGVGAIGLGWLGGGESRAQAWKPDKAVEIVATNAPGGGSDRIIRIMLNVLQERKDLFPVPLTIANKPGGGSAVAFSYLNQHAGDGHRLVMASKAMITNNIVGRGPHYSEMTPV